MSKKWVLLLIFAYIISVPSTAMAAASDPIQLDMEPLEMTAKPNTIAVFRLTITNNLGMKDDFLIRTYGSRIEWKIPGDVLVEIDSGKSKTTELVFYTGSMESSHKYDVKVYSKSLPGVNSSSSLRLTVEKPPEIMITSLEAAVDGEHLDIKAGLESSVRKEFGINFYVKDSNGIIVSEFSVSKEVDGTGGVNERISIGGMEPGAYTLEASVFKDTEETGFSIDTVRDVEESLVKTPSLLYDEVSITVYNNGNVVERGYTVTYTLPPGDYMTGFITQPDYCSQTEGGNACTFTIDALAPASSREIIFRMEYWPSYTRLIFAVVVILAMGTIYFKRFGHPRIRKSYITKGRDTHHVIIEIKSPKKKLGNVVVRDWVSPLARVAADSFKHAKPVVRRSEAGTELIWRLGDILAKEERILSYSIKTIVEGHLKMPKAYLRFMDAKGNRTRVYSGSIEIK